MTSCQTSCFTSTTVTYTLDEAENKDWNETWEEAGFEPIDIEGRVRVVDANHLSTAHYNSTGNDSKDVLEIKIAAWQAFGTGTHQTTQMIIADLLHQDASPQARVGLRLRHGHPGHRGLQARSQPGCRLRH